MEGLLHDNHLRVAQDPLKRQDVAAGSEVGSPKGVTTAMRFNVR